MLRGLNWHRGGERWYVAGKPLCLWPALGEPIRPLCTLGEVSSQLHPGSRCAPLKDSRSVLSGEASKRKAEKHLKALKELLTIVTADFRDILNHS